MTRQFTIAAVTGLIALATMILPASVAIALDLTVRQVAIEAKFITIKESRNSGFGFDWQEAQPFAQNGDGKSGGVSFKFGLGIFGNKEDYPDNYPDDYPDSNSNSSANRESSNSGLQILVTPKILAGDGERITLDHLNSQTDKVGNVGIVNETIIVATNPNATRDVDTLIIVADDQTFVVGGLIEKRKENWVDDIPVFGNVPLIGALFRTRDRANTEPQLILHITPHIVGH